MSMGYTVYTVQYAHFLYGIAFTLMSLNLPKYAAKNTEAIPGILSPLPKR